MVACHFLFRHDSEAIGSIRGRIRQDCAGYDRIVQNKARFDTLVRYVRQDLQPLNSKIKCDGNVHQWRTHGQTQCVIFASFSVPTFCGY